MTEQMKQALDKAAKGLQWSQGSILIDKKTLKPVDPAEVPLERLVHLPVPDKLDMAAHFGANWYRNNMWHNVSEEADLSKYVLLYDEADGYMSPPCRFPFRDMPGFVSAMNRKYGANYTKWAYMEDLLPDK